MICSGEWVGGAGVADYATGQLTNVFVERLVWSASAESQYRGSSQVAGPGFVWFRFWLEGFQQVVEKYFDAAGRPVGLHVDVCGPFQMGETGWMAEDRLLDIWISVDGRVTVRNEALFEQAVANGTLSADAAEQAESHIRELTGAIAKGRFPPALVRNWQLDLNRLQEILAP